MKYRRPKILVFSLFILALLAGCWQQQNTSGPNSFATETAMWQSVWDSVLATNTQSIFLTTEALRPTVTPLSFLPTPVTPATITPVIQQTPLPTATFHPITPMTPLPLKGIHLSGKVVYDSPPDGSVINLIDYHFDAPLQVEMHYYDSRLYHGAWSRDGEYVAQPLYLTPLNGDSRYTDLAICILDGRSVDNNKLWEKYENQAKCIRIYTNINNPRSVTQGDYAEIKNVAWSPNNKYLLVIVKGFDVVSPCLVEMRTGSVDCHWARMFDNRVPTYSGTPDKSYTTGIVVTGAHAISWSPQDENKLVIPLKTNWLSLTEGVENGHSFASNAPWYSSTYNVREGLYLINITPDLVYAYPPVYDRILTLLWETPQNTTLDPDQLPVWTSDGEQVAFVYVDPWFNVKKSLRFSMLPIANYVVGMIGEDGKNFQKVFDSRSMYLSGVLPSGSSLPTIQIHRWVYQDRFLLFTAQIYVSDEDKYAQSLFLYDAMTNQFFQVTNWNQYGN